MRVVVLIGLFAWLLIKITETPPLPDWRSGELVVVVPDAAMVTDSAFESDLAAMFAKHLNARVHLIQQPADQAVATLLAGEAHLAAGFRSQSNPSLRYSKGYQRLDERVVCNGKQPRKLDELTSRELVVARESAQEAALRKLREEFDELDWRALKNSSPVELLTSLAEGEIDCTIANEEQITTMRNYYPDIRSGLSLDLDSDMSWAISAEGDEALLDEVNRFLDEISRNRALHHAIDRHYGHNDRLGSIDVSAFINDTRSVLPQYRQWFQEAADLTGIDWHLIAALGYQESHWDPNATSYTNVRGLMMLTESTADRMGVENRLDPKASIMAGARYLQMLKEQLPPRISEQNRLWMALAAYNQGMGHLEDARILTAQNGLNPDIWSDVRQVMPLLARPEVYENTKFGHARGGEAVILVETVRLYHDILKRLDNEGKLSKPTPLPFWMEGL
jgi:membrane-bound lytic murein transglycosylase F